MFERAFEALALRFGKIEIRSSFISYGEKISFYIHILRLLCLKKKVFLKGSYVLRPKENFKLKQA